MTSSFSNLVLAGVCLAYEPLMGPLTTCAAAEAQAQFALIDRQMNGLANTVEDRLLLLASPPLFGWAQEGALKVLEMTAGRFPVMAETYLGLRHGPMSFVRTNTMVICLLSNDPWNRRYELDLVRELRSKGLGYLVGICDDRGDRSDEITQLFDAVTPALLPQAPDPVRTAFEILALQILSYRLSLRAGLNPDNPSPAGVLTRVVQGIHIYD
jgi:tagatose-6-phosphate ketose/aldose isomerase